MLGVVSFFLRDLRGPDTGYRGSLLLAKEEQSLFLTYRAPVFWGRDRSGGVRFSYESFDYDNDAFDYQIASATTSHNFRVGPNVRAELRYSLAWDRIDDIASFASNILRSEAGFRISSSVGFSVITGSELLGRAGLGGDTELSTSKLSFYGKLPLGGSACRSKLNPGRSKVTTRCSQTGNSTMKEVNSA